MAGKEADLHLKITIGAAGAQDAVKTVQVESRAATRAWQMLARPPFDGAEM
jgi:hypothetical protein